MVYFSQVITPLVRTPVPFHGESVRGFVLRSSEVNGYQSPLKLLNYAGMDDEEARSARPPLDKLARLYGRTAQELKLSGLDGNESFKKGRRLSLMGHDIPTMFMRAKHSGICVQCIKEDGYIEAYGELKYALVCPHHGMKMLHQCPSCKKPISWQRIGLLRCSCGSDLSINQATVLENPTVILLMKILYAKLMNEPLDEAETTLQGFPLEAMQTISLQTLLSMIHRFGAFQRDKATSDEMQQLAAIRTTSDILSNWPHRFYDYIETVHAPHADMTKSGLRGQFNLFCESLFKNMALSNEMDFMREAFNAFGEERWKKAKTLKIDDAEESQLVGINGLAEVLKLQPSTVRKLVNLGIINPRHLNGKARAVFDLRQIPFGFAEGKSLSLKVAAERLGLPVDVLRSYRMRGFYGAKYFAIPPALFHEKDVAELLEALMGDCPLIEQFDPKEHITMQQFMLKKLGPTDIKARFIVAVRDGLLCPIAKSGEKAADLVFMRKKIEMYIKRNTGRSV
jgi:hypothetical protein